VHPGARRFRRDATPASVTSSSRTVKGRHFPGGNVKRGEVVKAVVVRTVKERQASRRQLHQVRRERRRLIIKARQTTRAGNAHFSGPVGRETARESGFMKIISLAPEVL